MKIELSGEILVYTGRSRGKADRERFKLRELDRTPDVITIVVPDSVYTMTSSYFLELLGDSIRRLGRDAFVKKYKFMAPNHVGRKVDDWINRALREKRGLLSDPGNE